MKLRIAQIRIVPEKGQLASNVDKLRGALDAIAPRRPDVVVTPECFLDGYVVTRKSVAARDLNRFAIDAKRSPITEEIAAWASQTQTWVILGCTRKYSGGACNSTLIFDRRGRLAGVYDKIHCQIHDRKFVPGKTLPVFDSDFGVFGVMICADRRWPETVRTLALKGARIIFNPTYGMSGDLNLAMMRTRSYESEVFIAFTHPSLSLITAPDGRVVTRDGRQNRRFTISRVNLTEVDRVRRAPFPAHLRDCRTDAR